MRDRDARRPEPGRPDGRPPASRNEVSGGAHGTVVQVGSVGGDVNLHVAPAVPPVPAQLPAPPPYFTGRARELDRLTELSDAALAGGSPAVVVITGVGGVGKTSLTLTWLHRIRSAFPDGQLFADLRAFTAVSAGVPRDPGELLGRFLRALGVPPERTPPDADEQAALFRSLLADRRMLIMLDNAATAAQVRPLLPGQGPVVVAVTSRRRLSGLAVDGAAFLPLAPLGQDGARQLLDRMLGMSRTRAEQGAADELAELCGRLPLALCTAAARLASRGHLPISRVVAELADESGRLAALGGEEGTSVQAVFDLAYRDLPPETAALYRLLSVHPGADFDAAAVAALAEVDDAEATARLEHLVDAHLLEAGTDGRYRLHDLARLHARQIAERADPADERAGAFVRLLEHYLATAVAADRVIIPERWRLGPYYERPPVVSFENVPAAIDWLETELANLTDLVQEAHDRGLHRQVWQVCEALWGCSCTASTTRRGSGRTNSGWSPPPPAATPALTPGCWRDWRSPISTWRISRPPPVWRSRRWTSNGPAGICAARPPRWSTWGWPGWPPVTGPRPWPCSPTRCRSTGGSGASAVSR
ncbi:NB-ARC domain-containing protein [Thermomonospora cellulosilytica]|uniref:Orc1-like AAA ATPase domain-containing protein n=1 Tax=Thermomonospora cellulosilytica TaxID=1411118 RepID=A0A7W3MVA1_9ACTN|nr:NB-ARC domain-containing protein [Thermomonospora cellulosilytica]MBA9002530.1 hypothetical protein [Thermomonospora cellulosilytica]